MFWITFIVSGTIVASLPWIASQFNETISGYILTVPIMFALGVITQYINNGADSTISMIEGALWALPSLAIFGVVIIYLINLDFDIGSSILIAFIAWATTVLLINNLVI